MTSAVCVYKNDLLNPASSVTGQFTDNSRG